jgi:hypothetical protein
VSGMDTDKDMKKNLFVYEFFLRESGVVKILEIDGIILNNLNADPDSQYKTVTDFITHISRANT